MGSELQARGVPMDHEAWSGVANLDHQDVVREIHEDYIRAGADVIIANTYAAGRIPLEQAGYDDRVAEANRRAVEAARQARENAAERPVAIAGSMSIAVAVDVMSRRPPTDPARLPDLFREQAGLLADAGVDLIALEMISEPWFGKPALEAAAATGLPVWLGVSVESPAGGRVPTLGGEHDLRALLEGLPDVGVAAVTVMHSDVGSVLPAIEVIAQVWDGPLGAYPHVGDWTPPEWVFHDVTPEAYAAQATRWVERGVQLVGGCCGIGPAHIRAVKDTVPATVPAGSRPAL
jgi:S-methylmethionine-dependent homocysteine/selenocysteine methylase